MTAPIEETPPPIEEGSQGPVATPTDEPTKILLVVAEALKADVRMEPGKDGKVYPQISIDELVSKLLALLVFCGANVPSHFAPAYNRVHADVEFWKKELEKKEG